MMRQYSNDLGKIWGWVVGTHKSLKKRKFWEAKKTFIGRSPRPGSLVRHVLASVAVGPLECQHTWIAVQSMRKSYFKGNCM